MKTTKNQTSTETKMIVYNISPPTFVVVFISVKVQTILLERVMQKINEMKTEERIKYVSRRCNTLLTRARKY